MLWGLRKAFPVWWNCPYISQIITYHSSYKNITPIRDWTLQGDICYSLTSWSHLHILVHIWSSITAVHLEGPLSDCSIKDSKLAQLLMGKLSFPVSVLNMQSTHNTTNLQRAWLYTPELAHCYFKDWDLLTYKEKQTGRLSMTTALSDSWHYQNKIVFNQFVTSMTYLTII